jgi:uncharacterized integral membrane protein (TIGR00698 family)
VPPRWLPKRSDLAGLALVAALGGGAIVLTRALPRSPLISDVLVAMLLGALVVNTPLGTLVGVRLPRDCGAAPDRYAGGVAFACSWLLRLAIVLMGLKVQTSSIGGAELLLVLAVCATAIPATFFIAQTLGARLGLRRPFADVLAAGSMICGASAVNATAPIVGAEKQEQGLAVGIVFLSSVAAMLSFRAIAHAVGLPAGEAGLWAGLAVNDLSSAVAVGTQMGGDGGVTAAAAKSTRILMMAPMLVALALLRRSSNQTSTAASNDASHAATASATTAPRDAAPLGATLRKSIVAVLPRFILGYLALAIVRVAGDRAFGPATSWHAVLDTNRSAVELLMAMVSAGIGLNLAVRSLVTSSSRGIATSVGASAFMAALTLFMVTTAHRHGLPAALGVGAAGLFLSYAIHCRLGSRARADALHATGDLAALPPAATALPAGASPLTNPDCALARRLAGPP